MPLLKRLFASAMSFLAVFVLRGEHSWSLAVLSGLFARDEAVWQFDLLSAVIGFVLGLLLSLGTYLLRNRIAAFRDAATSRARRVQDRLSTGVADRYREQVIQTAEYNHLLKRYVALSQVYVEQRFIVPHALPRSNRPEDSDQEGAHWRDMRLLDVLHPSREMIDLGNALKQHNCLAVLGPMGSGRTTFLSNLARVFAQREGWRLTLPEPQEEDPPELQEARNREQERIPVWIALEALDFSLAEKSGRHVLIEPITEYVASSLRGIIAQTSALMAHTRIIEGNCVLLFDNLDMLDAETREQALNWLDKLIHAYPENVFVLTGLPQGYGALWKIGFAPLLLDGFGPREVSRFVESWQSIREEVELQAWETEAEAARQAFEAEVATARREGRPVPSEADFPQLEMSGRPPDLLHVWRAGRRHRVMPLDLALAALLWREQDDVPAEALMRYAQTVFRGLNRATDSLLGPPQWARILASVAWAMQSEERYEARRAEIEQPVADILTQIYSAAMAAQADQDEEEEPDFGRQARGALNALIGTGDLLLGVGRGRVAFVHPTFRAYFAAQHAARSEVSDRIVAHIRDPRWQDMILFYSALTDVAPLVRARLKGTDDLFRSNFFAAAGYLAASPEADRRLQGGVLAELAQVFLNPLQPTILCRQAATAIADTEDKGALYLFGQALQHADPHVRRLGVWGLAQMDHERVLAGLLHALSDEDRLVRIEALYALGSLGDDEAIDGLVQGLQDEDGLTRRAAAEALATIGGEGHDLLRQGIESDDMYIRRAAIYGLGAVGEPWAYSIVEPMSREDPEWFVRSAAEEVKEQFTDDPPPIKPEPPKLENEAWLVTWAAQQGVGLGTGGVSLRVVLRAVKEGDWTIRLAAADALRVCGDRQSIPALQAVLNDDDVLVREAAYTALEEIGQRTGMSIQAK